MIFSESMIYVNLIMKTQMMGIIKYMMEGSYTWINHLHIRLKWAFINILVKIIGDVSGMLY